MPEFNESFLKEQRELIAKASPGPWRHELGLYITSEECPLCTLKHKAPEMGHMVAQAELYLDEEEKRLVAIRGWGHLSYHGEEKAITVQKANAELIVQARSHYPAALDEITRLRSLLWASVLCGGCGNRYKYNRADDPTGELASEEHALKRLGQCGKALVSEERNSGV